MDAEQAVFNPAEFRVSQSMMKKYQEYSDRKVCGELFRRLYITADVQDKKDSNEILKGHYFEYLVTGAVPIGREVPTAQKYQTNGTRPDDTKYKVGDEKPDWALVRRQAVNCLLYLAHYGMKIIDSNRLATNPIGRGLLDLVVEVDAAHWVEVMSAYNEAPVPRHECVYVHPVTGVRHEGAVVVDLKYSGLLYDRWNEFGWDLDSLPDKVGPTVQAKHYHWLTGLPFFFFVFDSKVEDARLIRVRFDPAVEEEGGSAFWGLQVAQVRAMILAEVRAGFNPYPSLKRCVECPARETCELKANHPRVEVVDFGV
jgi:hypothetical protein